jgi:hypothetical protein
MRYVRTYVCVHVHGVIGQLSKLHDTHAWLMPISIHYYALFPFFHLVKNLVVTRLCPGFIADSAPHQVNNVEGGEGRTVVLLQLNGLSVGRGEVWVRTDPRDALSRGFDISIHVSSSDQCSVNMVTRASRCTIQKVSQM